MKLPQPLDRIRSRFETHRKKYASEYLATAEMRMDQEGDARLPGNTLGEIHENTGLTQAGLPNEHGETASLRHRVIERGTGFHVLFTQEEEPRIRRNAERFRD
jgi:hypothetical protein